MMRLPFQNSAPTRTLRNPEPSVVPKLENSSIAAHYRAARVGGDFFDFLVTDSGRLVFLLVDIAGRRDEALHIAASVQERMRATVAELFRKEDMNEADALNRLLIEINRDIISAAGGVRCAPAFLGCYHEGYGTLAYINAGHPPALIKDGEGLTQLDANGFPLGLFSHATHDALITALPPGAALLLVSRGLVESKAGSKEFGLERLKECVGKADCRDAHALCMHVLNAVKEFTEKSWRKKESENDVTTLALVRAVERASAAASS